jgi:hypothetical protein
MFPISHARRGFVCLCCGEFNEIDDDSVGACDCEREAERREERRRHLIWRYRAKLVRARLTAKRTGRQFRAEHRGR